MTKCFLTDKTYPDYSPEHDPKVIQAGVYNVCSHIDFVNREQGDLALQCAHLIFNLMNNNPDAFKAKLASINMMVSNQTPDQKHHVNTLRMPVFKQAVAEIADYILEETYGDRMLVTDENGDERYSDVAQERFNEHHDAIEGIFAYFVDLPDEVEVSDENA